MILRKLMFMWLFFSLLSLHALAVDGPVKFLRACPQTSGDDVILSWVVPTDNCGSFVSYQIWGRENPSTPFRPLDSVFIYGTSQYTHVNAKTTSLLWEYFVVVRFLCNNSETPASDTLRIDSSPLQPELDSVSVDIISNSILLGWTANNEKDIKGYRINIEVNSVNIPKAFVTNTFFISTPENPQTQSFSYNLSAEDSCNLVGGISKTHRTIFLQGLVDTCPQTASLSWSKYDGWATGKHEVWASINGGPFGFITELPGSATSYTYNGLPLGDSVTFFVRAFSSQSQASSTSNTWSVKINGVALPKFCYVRCADVVEPDNNVKLTWYFDLSGQTLYFKVFRSLDGVNFIQVDSLNNDNVSEKTYTDASVNADGWTLYYSVKAYDLCNRLQISSRIVKTIHLKTTSFEIESVRLKWGSYKGFDKDIKEYKISRAVDLGTGFNWQNIFKSGDTLYTDNKLPDEPGEKGFCYKIAAIEDGPNQYGYSDSCNSNVSCAEQPIIAFFPNAFVPTGVNTHFRPVISFADLGTSYMVIYDRWGGIVKKIPDLRIGWDGTGPSNELMQEGVYFYVANLYSTLNGTTRIYSGHVFLFNSE